MTTTWLGSWSSTTAYAISDGVYHDGVFWTALASSTNVEPTLSAVDWLITVLSLTYKGAWAAGSYQPGDTVRDPSNLSVCIVSGGITTEPSADAVSWLSTASLLTASGPSGVPPGTIPAGATLPAGGTSNQVLTKLSGTDYDAFWETPASELGNATQLQGHDVSTTAPTDQQALVWDATTSKWLPQTPATPTTPRNLAEIQAQWVLGSVVANGSFTFAYKARYAGTISALDSVSGTGSFTVAVEINGTPVTGLGAVAVTSTPATTSATGADTFSAGDHITGVVTSATGSPTNAVLNLNVTWD